MKTENHPTAALMSSMGGRSSFSSNVIESGISAAFKASAVPESIVLITAITIAVTWPVLSASYSPLLKTIISYQAFATNSTPSSNTDVLNNYSNNVSTGSTESSLSMCLPYLEVSQRVAITSRIFLYSVCPH